MTPRDQREDTPKIPVPHQGGQEHRNCAKDQVHHSVGSFLHHVVGVDLGKELPRSLNDPETPRKQGWFGLGEGGRGFLFSHS